MVEISWRPFEEGATLGQPGSEQGIILRDEEHALGARITLERGIYGWMMHTRFFAAEDEANAQYEQMKDALSSLLEAAEQTAAIDGGREVLMDGIDEFIGNYP